MSRHRTARFTEQDRRLIRGQYRAPSWVPGGHAQTIAAAIGVPTLLLSGGMSPYLTQRIAGRLASLIEGAEAHHFPAGGHMLPLTHARLVNPLISAHISRANDLAVVPLASGSEVGNLISDPELAPAPK